MPRGLLIVLDGTDGSGKATQTELLAERLRARGQDVETADYPRYGEKSAGMIEEYLNGNYGDAEEVGPYRASIFYACDRYADSKRISALLEAGYIVIANRYTTSNMGHQAGKINSRKEQDQFLEWVQNLEYNIFGITPPDLCVLLHMPPEIGQQLVNEKLTRAYLKTGSHDIHEADLTHLHKADEAYQYVASKYNWHIIECAKDNKPRSIEAVHQELWAFVKSYLDAN
jgi:dTMP kinase